MKSPLLSASITEGLKYSPVSITGTYVKAPTSAAAVETCVLGAAYLGTLNGRAAVERFQGKVAAGSPHMISHKVHAELVQAFPALTRSISLFPVLCRNLRRDYPEALRPVGSYKTSRTTYALLPSLHGVLAMLHDTANWSRERTAEYLARAGL